MKRLLTTLALLVGAPAVGHCVHLDGAGLGQALIYPYYTTQNKSGSATFNTLVSVANTRDETKVVRVRLREGRNGREVLGLNVYLAPNDVWTAALILEGTNDALGAMLVTNDASCTNPVVPPTGVRLSTAAFTGTNADGLGGEIERTSEGYIEMIEMATLTGASAASATHSPTTFLPSCNGLVGTSVALETAPPTGGLMGTLTVINVATGEDFTVNAEALARLTTRAFYRNYNDPYPDFNAAEVDPVSLVVSGGKTYRMTWANGLDAVQSAFMRVTAENEVILDTATLSATDWIVTFPTKRFFDPSNPRPPFDQVSRPAGREIHFVTRFRPRDGSDIALMDSCEFICPPGWFQGYNLRMPWVSSTLSFQPQTPANEIGAATVSKALASRNAWFVPLSTGSASGAASIAPEGMGALGAMAPLATRSLRHSDGAIADESVRLMGFPMVGFAVRTFNNGRLTCGAGACQGNYGGSFAHKWTTSVRP